eukprot:9632510-Heterocapsa_arctica.AAC.1
MDRNPPSGVLGILQALPLPSPPAGARAPTLCGQEMGHLQKCTATSGGFNTQRNPGGHCKWIL